MTGRDILLSGGMTRQMAKEWQPMADACRILGISDRTLRRRIESGEIESQLEGRRRYVLIDIESSTSQLASHIADSDTAAGSMLMGQLQSENEHLRQQVERLRDELKAERERTESERHRGEQANERSDTIILQLTRQLEHQQLMLEAHTSPWYRRWFGREKLEK